MITPEEEEDDNIASMIAGQEADVADMPNPLAPRGPDMSKANDGDIAEAMGYDRSIILDRFRAEAEGRKGFAAQADAYRQGYQKAMAGQQRVATSQAIAQAKRQADPRYAAQMFYTQTGDLNAAITISKSTGSALFDMGQEIDLGSFGAFAMAPKGNIDLDDGKGGRMRVPTRWYAEKKGIGVIPFTSGDENADAFRTSLNDTQRIMGLLDRLEVLYNDSGYIGSLSPTVRAAEAKAIESQLATGILKVLNGTKSLASVSEGEMNMVMGSIPQAASTFFTNLRGNESVKLNKLRNDLTNVIFRAADQNGIALIPMKRQAPATREGGNPPTPSGVTF